VVQTKNLIRIASVSVTLTMNMEMKVRSMKLLLIFFYYWELNFSLDIDKIITGSFSGIIRIFKPHRSKYQAIDLLLEQQVDGPVIQIEIGKFIPGSQDNAMAILMPRKLCVYSIYSEQVSNSRINNAESIARDENSSSNSYISVYSMIKIYEHELDRISFNFTYGPFGGTYGRDYFCVQSLDGQLAFYEQDHFTFSCFLTDSLLPGPLIYNKNTDSFITFNSCQELESYKYQILASSSNEKSIDSGGKRIQAEWSINIGEEVHDIKIARYSQSLSASQNEIIVIGDRTLFTIKESGKITSQKRLDYFPSAFCVYTQSMEKAVARHNLIIGTHNKTLMIYKDPKLVWSAGTNFIPVAVRVGKFGGIKSLIVMMDDCGNLSVNYLGTDAISNSAPIMESKEIDFVEIQEEHSKLQSLIRQAQNAGKFEPSDKLLIKVKVPIAADNESLDAEGINSIHFRKRTIVKLYLGYTGENVSLKNIDLNISVQPPFYTTKSSIHIENLQGGSRRTPFILPITIYNDSQCIPTSLKVDILAVYNAPTGELRTTKSEFLLPLSLAGDVVVQKKSSTHKITLDINRKLPPLTILFEDLLKNIDGEIIGTGNTLTFQYTNNQDATILVSKSSGRYRIQSSDFEAIWILCSELIRRLEMFYTSTTNVENSSEDPFYIDFVENLPFQQYFAKIDDHFSKRLALKESLEVLEKISHQFRSIQKRLLIRFMDKNPTSINNMDKLLDKTYLSLIEQSDIVQKCERELEISQRNLSCSTNLLLLLLKLKMRLSEKEIGALSQYLSPNVIDNGNQGWEEITQTGISYLLKTVLSTNNKEDSDAFSSATSLEMIKDTTKLKKYIALVYERISKGMSLTRIKEKQMNDR
jgi:Bardet-Biedl syndrome 9 protein